MTELEAINRMLAAIGQAPVNTVDQANPDVAICSRTLKQVSQEVQSEGWTFNRVNNFMEQPSQGLLIIRSGVSNGDTDYIMQMDLSHNSFFSRDKQTIAKNRGATICLYNLTDSTFDWGNDPIEVDKTYYYADIGVTPPPAQNYIISKASAAISFQTVGDPNQYQILKSQEEYTRTQLLEYETSQGDYSFFGQPINGNFYNSYQPFHTLSR
jgi:hypothetical protein